MFKLLSAINRWLVSAVIALYRLSGWTIIDVGNTLIRKMPFIAGFVVVDLRCIAVNSHAGAAAELLYISDEQSITKENLTEKLIEEAMRCIKRRGYCDLFFSRDHPDGAEK